MEKNTTILYFSASWCGPCHKLSPTVTELQKIFNIQKIDCDESKDLTTKFNIKSIPCFIKFNDNMEEVGRIVGMTTKDKLIEFIERKNEI